MDEPTKHECLMNDAEAAVFVGGLHRKTVQRMARHRQLPAYRIGKYWRFKASELAAWLGYIRRARITRLLNLERRCNEQTLSTRLSVP